MGSTVGGRMAQGTVEGSASTIDIDLEFTPSAVYLMNIDGLATLWWNAAMAPDSGLKAVTDGTISFVTSDGITPILSTVLETDSPGFTIGTETDVQQNGETIHWCAWE